MFLLNITLNRFYFRKKTKNVKTGMDLQRIEKALLKSVKVAQKIVNIRIKKRAPRIVRVETKKKAQKIEKEVLKTAIKKDVREAQKTEKGAPRIGVEALKIVKRIKNEM